ncbi:hypothetical protein PVK06_012126 [Gossypium arboreum]|uniref:Uncharacterized protein n=1 Tax=Gossypium arboreum TaxID=29729 RepID=A0ABR0QBB0_GOSAR|nr:hypothetical protein PVK06_012126 [Gossypium arboreum]
MSIEPTFVEGSVPPPTSTDFGKSLGEASSQTKRTTGKRKVIPQRLEVWSHFTKIINNDCASKAKCFKKMNKPVEHVKGTIRYLRQTLARLKKFKECVVVEKIECKKMFCLDVCTRWNSTYLMLDTTQNFERAFERFEEQDTNFRVELDWEEGWPSADD